jgi:hypothetical protein
MTSPGLAVLLAVNGVGILFVSLFAGLLLYRTLLRGQEPHDWHLLHAGGSGRGVMLMALAGIIHLAVLPSWLLWWATLAIILFAWASTMAMLITGLTGESGFRQQGPLINRLAHALYVAGAAAVFPGMAIIGFGLARQLLP